MRIRLNGDSREIEGRSTLGALIDGLGLDRAWVVVERNSEVPDRGAWDATLLQEDDQIEVVRFMGGGR